MSTDIQGMDKTSGAIHDDNNIKGFFGDYRYLSNFHLVEIEYEGIKYPSVENAYMAAKTLDIDIRKQFPTLSPPQAKKLGRSIKLRDDWEKVKFDIMYQLNKSKYSNEPLKGMLLSTGNKYLEETNWWGDRIWGVCNGTGENNLGKILMKIREEIK